MLTFAKARMAGKRVMVMWYTPARSHNEFRHFSDCTVTIRWWRYSHQKVWIHCETIWLVPQYQMTTNVNILLDYHCVLFSSPSADDSVWKCCYHGNSAFNTSLICPFTISNMLLMFVCVRVCVHVLEQATHFNSNSMFVVNMKCKRKWVRTAAQR